MSRPVSAKSGTSLRSNKVGSMDSSDEDDNLAQMEEGEAGPPSRQPSAWSRAGSASVDQKDGGDVDADALYAGDGQDELGKAKAAVAADELHHDHQHDDKKSGGACCCGCFLTTTVASQETEKDRERYVKTLIRELIIYLIYLVVLSIVAFGMSSNSMYYYTRALHAMFIENQFPDTRNNFGGMGHPADFWRFVETPLVDGLYWEKWYNGENLTEQGYLLHENKLLGVPRIRQLKVTNSSCDVAPTFRDNITSCYDTYSRDDEFRECFGQMEGQEKLALDVAQPNETAWCYYSSEELDGASHFGILTNYGGGGFIMDLPTSKKEAQDVFAYLKKNRWLDRGTRVVFFDFTVYNANVNLFCVIRLVIEFPATGGLIPSWNFRTVKLIRYVSILDYVVLACEGIFVFFILYYTLEEVLEIKSIGCKYFGAFWNIIDIVVLLLAYVSIAFNVYRNLVIGPLLDDVLALKDQFMDFEFFGFWQTQVNNLMAVMVFLSWVKTFKYISFNKTMTQLSNTLSRCAKDISGFLIMFCIIFFAFGQMGYLVFGTQVKDFSTFGKAVFTQLRIVLGDFNYTELEQANRVLGPIYFMAYMFFIVFVLLNMFLAIINDTYSNVKQELAKKEDQLGIGSYFKKSYDKMMNKMSSKRDKLQDIQKALRDADLDANQVVEFEEWRNVLKSRGYTDAEIEAVFAKYDIDGDRTLDAGEQKQMIDDLEQQKDNLVKEMETKQKMGIAGNDAEAVKQRMREAAAGGGVGYEEFDVLSRRVDRMEHSVGSIVSKIDNVLTKLHVMEEGKREHRQAMKEALVKVNEAREMAESEKKKAMEAMLKEEEVRPGTRADTRAATRAATSLSQRPESSAS